MYCVNTLLSRGYMKYQALFSLKNNEKKKYLWMLSAAVVIGALRIKRANDEIAHIL